MKHSKTNAGQVVSRALALLFVCIISLGVLPNISVAVATDTSDNVAVIEAEASSASITYRTHVQSYGWQSWKSDGQMSGTSGESKRLEGIEIMLQDAPYSGSITYRTHV